MATRISISRITIQATVDGPAPMDSNADFARPPDDTVHHDAVKTDARKDEREPEKRGQHREQALAHERRLDPLSIEPTLVMNPQGSGSLRI